MREILLPLSEEEAVAVSVALVALVHDKYSPDQWRIYAEAVGIRLIQLREAEDQ